MMSSTALHGAVVNMFVYLHILSDGFTSILPAGFATRSQGYGASSLWKQRAHRWTVSALRITGKSLYSFFTYDSRGGVLSNIAFRLYRYF